MLFRLEHYVLLLWHSVQSTHWRLECPIQSVLTSKHRFGGPGEVGGVVGLGEAPAEPLLLGQLVDRVGEVGKVGPVLRLEGPAHEQNVLDFPRGLEVGQRRLHALAHQPDDRLRRLHLPRPLGGQQLVPGNIKRSARENLNKQLT